MSLDISWRCSICAVNWPLFGNYETCPLCGEACSRFSETTPLAIPEAEAIVAEHRRQAKADEATEAKRVADRAFKRKQFDEYYAEREAKAIDWSRLDSLLC